ncbi:MAG: glycoside hydrolase family 2 TIM barrel-domain containing protein, partial [Oscillospiraceae bacterium]
MISNNRVLFNSNWIYKENQNADGKVVDLPHCNKEMPLQYFDEKEYQFISNYSHKMPEIPEGKRVFLQMDGVMSAFTLSAGDIKFTECKGGYLPHTVELTNIKCADTLNIEVDSREREDIPPFGFAIDYLTFGGIYRDIWLYTTDACVLTQAFVRYEVTQINGTRGTVKCTPEIHIDSALEYKAAAKISVKIQGESFALQTELTKGNAFYTLPSFEIENIELWSLEAPKLYTVEISLTGDEFADTASLSIGFRKMELTENGAYLNGKRINLMGLNRHQSYPYVGYAMPKRAQQHDAQALKYELGLNLVRSSHYPPSPWFLDECDKLGLLVMEEMPGWQYISKREDWRKQACSDVKDMVTRDFNHPCVITWGVRINESQDDDELYTQTNKIAREIDSSRPTSGVRCLEHSHMLEDIYTMNDFIHDGSSNILRTQEHITGLSNKVPYMVTEFCGHMYPTKRFDQEERLIEHALRHGRVQSLAAQKDDTLGAVGWCAFDYNTHYDFGSGDRVCYHGVMDMFRIPKFAAAVYKSQRPVNMGYVLEPLTYWARGERDAASL